MHGLDICGIFCRVHVVGVGSFSDVVFFLFHLCNSDCSPCKLGHIIKICCYNLCHVFYKMSGESNDALKSKEQYFVRKFKPSANSM